MARNRQLDFTLSDNREYICPPDQGGGLYRRDRNTGSPVGDGQKLKQWGGPDWSAVDVWTEMAARLHERLKKAKRRGTQVDDRVVLIRKDSYSHDTDDDFLTVTPLARQGFLLATGNLIGSVVRREQDGNIAGRVNVGSRFGDVFLRHIISDADGFVRIKDLGGERHDTGYEWLLDYLWNIKFRAAFRLGLPKCYCSKSERLVGVRGEIDPVDFYGYEIRGNGRCVYRELSYDNPATELFAIAWRTLKRQNASRSFCSLTTQIYQTILQAVNGGSRKRSELLSAKPFGNALYAKYNELIELSKVVLERGSSDFAADSQMDALLFDVSMLFEYYIRKLLRRNGFRLVNKEHDFYRVPTCALKGSPLRKLIPDLVFETDNGVAIFDVKYKYFKEDEGVDREDVFQLHTYIGQYGNDKLIKACGFIYPILESRWHDMRQNNDGKVILSAPLRQQGQEIPFHVAFLVIPDSENQSAKLNDVEFAKRIDPWVRRFVSQLGACTSSVSNDGGNFSL